VTDLVVRDRRAEDLPRCAEVLHEVHLRDGYPTYWHEDPQGFVAGRGTLAAWVAVADGALVGHVTLGTADAVAVWGPCAEATGRELTGLGVVARLFVAPAARGHGVARALLSAAVDEADRPGRGLRPVLDVTVDNHEAIDFYERRGWVQVGEATLALADPPGATLAMALYVAPEPTLVDVAVV
jgi:GNAT superfamily N-acetyltransferase